MAKIVFICVVVQRFFCAGANLGALKSFVWKILVPLMKLVHAHGWEIINEVKWKKVTIIVCVVYSSFFSVLLVCLCHISFFYLYDFGFRLQIHSLML